MNEGETMRGRCVSIQTETMCRDRETYTVGSKRVEWGTVDLRRPELKEDEFIPPKREILRDSGKCLTPESRVEVFSAILRL